MNQRLIRLSISLAAVLTIFSMSGCFLFQAVSTIQTKPKPVKNTFDIKGCNGVELRVEIEYSLASNGYLNNNAMVQYVVTNIGKTPYYWQKCSQTNDASIIFEFFTTDGKVFQVAQPFYSDVQPGYTGSVGKVLVNVGLNRFCTSVKPVRLGSAVVPDSNEINAQVATGTGFALTSDGLIATNYHVIEGANSIKVKGVNGDFSKEFSATVLVQDVANDLAIIKITESSFSSLGVIPYTFASKSSDVGSSVFALGYPKTQILGDEIKVTDGIISSKTGFQDALNSYQISVPIQPGNSGGPLFDSNGNLVGITSAAVPSLENVSYAIKVLYLINLIDLLPTAPKLQTVNSLNGKKLPDQVKMLENYVYVIEVH
jgi:S1-C subfamily serine protease